MRAVAVIGLCAAVALGGCGGGKTGPRPSAPTPFPPTDRQQLGSLLLRRGNALEHGRLGALASTAIAARRSQELRAGRRARALGVVSARYKLYTVKVSDQHARLGVLLSYQVSGIAGDFGSPRTLLADRRQGDWRIAGPQGSRSADPWEVDDYVRRLTPHFVVWTPRDIEVPVTALEAGYARLRALLDRGVLRHRYLIVVARDAGRFRRITQRIRDVNSLTAISDTQVRTEGPAENVAQVYSQRVIISHSGFVAAGPDGRRTVVTHELTHAVLAPLTSGRVPGWLVEGLAMYVSQDDRRTEYAARRTVPTLAALSAPDALARATGAKRGAAYATASTAAYAIAGRYGRERLLALLEVFRHPSLPGRRGDPRMVDRATRQVLGVGLDKLQRSLG